MFDAPAVPFLQPQTASTKDIDVGLSKDARTKDAKLFVRMCGNPLDPNKEDPLGRSTLIRAKVDLQVSMDWASPPDTMGGLMDRSKDILIEGFQPSSAQTGSDSLPKCKELRVAATADLRAQRRPRLPDSTLKYMNSKALRPAWFVEEEKTWGPKVLAKKQQEHGNLFWSI